MKTQFTTEANNNPRPFNPATLAERWECSTTLVYDLLQSGKLEGFRLGKLWRIPAAAVTAYEAQPEPVMAESPLRPTASSETLEDRRERQAAANTAARLVRMGTR